MVGDHLQQPVHEQLHRVGRKVDEAHSVVGAEHGGSAAVGGAREGGERRAKPRQEGAVGGGELPRDEHALAADGKDVGAVRGEGERAEPLREVGGR